jgi:hypothetical protein
MKTNFSREQLEAALAVVNVRYSGNVRLIHGTETSRWRRFTLRVNSSKGPGAKISMTSFHDRRTVAACWFVHGDFFDALWGLEGGSVGAYYIEAGRVGRMRGRCDNWQDFNIGSAFRPIKFSQSCDCIR